MARGVVKWFNPTKGYGFIQPQGGGKDVFVHISAVERAGLTTLNEGQHLEYEIQENRGNTSAVNLKVTGYRYAFGETRVATLALLTVTTRSAACGVVTTKFSGHAVTFRSSATDFADTPTLLSTSTRPASHPALFGGLQHFWACVCSYIAPPAPNHPTICLRRRRCDCWRKLPKAEESALGRLRQRATTSL